ncbi:probable xyloglucan galactosyltransferase GT11 [Euphorbia lathyris]|uniref:probable xyloglucan galactosyltransferase GT11 n=1 Tax=Euphorbia lathyris TaxID=212925 RepID=UPI0033139527
MIGRGSNKFWYIILASFLLWFLLLFFRHSDLQNYNTQVSLYRTHFIDTYESYSVHKSNNNNDKEIKHQSQDIHAKESVVAPIPIEIGSEPKIKKDVRPDNHQKYLTVNETKSINKVFASTDYKNLTSVSVEKINKQPSINGDSDSESCSGRYIYMHRIPRQFNEDLIKHCELLSEWSNMCIFVSNFGFGPRLSDASFVPKTGWFHTNQFMLEVIFHNRMKTYKCLTNDSSLASAIFVPYYAGLDVARYLWDSNNQMKDYNPNSLTKWLRKRPEWKKLSGRDHFLVAGRITWDFRRTTDEASGWGNKLMFLPESKNMTILTIESSPWHANDFAIPYPSYFHPSTDEQVYTWQNRVKNLNRKYLFSFAGGPRPPAKDRIRAKIVEQCRFQTKRCKLLECQDKGNKCYKPVNVMKFFQTSSFCLQPPGDSYTRRSTFDSILAGCIPVFFHPGSAYVQYSWHFPKDYTKYSVFIPEDEVNNGNTSIESVLDKIPKGKRIAMREQVIKLIPGVVYGYPNSSMEILEDAFDISIDGVLERVENIRRNIREGKNVSSVNEEKEEFSWKKNLIGTSAEHDWEKFFRKQ